MLLLWKPLWKRVIHISGFKIMVEFLLSNQLHWLFPSKVRHSFVLSNWLGMCLQAHLHNGACCIQGSYRWEFQLLWLPMLDSALLFLGGMEVHICTGWGWHWQELREIWMHARLYLDRLIQSLFLGECWCLHCLWTLLIWHEA